MATLQWFNNIVDTSSLSLQGEKRLYQRKMYVWNGVDTVKRKSNYSQDVYRHMTIPKVNLLSYAITNLLCGSNCYLRSKHQESGYHMIVFLAYGKKTQDMCVIRDLLGQTHSPVTLVIFLQKTYDLFLLVWFYSSLIYESQFKLILTPFRLAKSWASETASFASQTSSHSDWLSPNESIWLLVYQDHI